MFILGRLHFGIGVFSSERPTEGHEPRIEYEECLLTSRPLGSLGTVKGHPGEGSYVTLLFADNGT